MWNWFKRGKQQDTSYRSNVEWVKSPVPPPNERAIADLRRILNRGLKSALFKHADRDINYFRVHTANLIIFLINCPGASQEAVVPMYKKTDPADEARLRDCREQIFIL